MRRSPSQPKPIPAQPRWKTVLRGGLLLALLLFAYWPALRGEFIWDDDAYITNNPLLTAADGWQRIWFSAHKQSQFFPLVFTTLRLEYALWGLSPLGYHLVNLLLHAANALLVWVVLKKLAVPGAWIGAGLFALHPVQVESVAWVTELKNTQSTFFFLLALFFWIRFLRSSSVCWRPYLLTIFFYILALLSKTTTCTLVAALVLVAWLDGQRLARRLFLQLAPFVILGLAAGVLSMWWEAHLGNYAREVGQSLTWLQRTLIASRALWFYAGKLVWPAKLTFSYPLWKISVNDWANYIWLVACLAVAWGLWRWRNIIGSRVIVAVIFFVTMLSPLLGFIPLYTFRYSYVADHYQYVASIGLLALAAAGLTRLGSRRREGAVSKGGIPPPHVGGYEETFEFGAGVGALLFVLALLTWRQAHVYQSPTSLWQDTLTKNPASWMAHNNLGQILKDKDDYHEAIRHYREAVRLNSGFAQAHFNLGIVLFKVGHTEEALGLFKEAVRLDPEDSRAFYNYALALDGTGRRPEAIDQYEQAIRLDPQYVGARINRGILFSQLGRLDEALTQFQEAVRLDPSHTEARNNFGAVLRAKGRFAEAREQFQAAVNLHPNHALAQSNLGAVLLALGDVDQAINHLETAIRLNPQDGEARRNLVRALEKKTRPSSP